MSGLVDRHLDFLVALRAAGVPVSLAEGVDAVAALSTLRWDDRETVRTAYAATVVKRATHRSTFDTLFDLYYPPLVGAGAVTLRRRRDEASATTRRRASPCARSCSPRWPPATRRPSAGWPSRRWAASGRCRGAVPGCRAGRPTPPCAGSRPTTWSPGSSRPSWTTGGPRTRRTGSPPAGSAPSRRWSRPRPDDGSRRRRGPTTSPTSPSGPASTASTSPPRSAPTSRRCAARSTRWPAGWRPGWPASSTPAAADRSTSGVRSGPPSPPAASR